MKKIFTAFLLFIAYNGSAQIKQDTTKKLKEVIIRPYFAPVPLSRTTGSIGLADQSTFKNQPEGSFVNTVNTIPGVRMEERSPGSYRLSIRGSLLRSPFGIRNVKIYLDDFPLTDAGGNTYFNALDVAGTDQLQILKGPQGSIYGANSGGVILVRPTGIIPDSNVVAFKAQGGSFGTFKENASMDQQFKNYSLNIVQSYQRSEGYRNHSQMERKYFQILQRLDYKDNASLKALIFFSDLQYNTPGGLTETQYLQDPKLSRPAAGASKSAIEQNAGIYSKTLYGGITHDLIINKNFKHVVSVFSSHTNFENPFITNYETREEFTLGLRTYLEYALTAKKANWKFNIGLESMKTSTNFDNYDNNQGKAGAVQSADDLRANSNFAFASLSLDAFKKLTAELSSSINLYEYGYRSIAPITAKEKTNKFDTQFMPRLALSYLLIPQLSARASVSKGYSPPTIPEVRASDNIVNVNLQPEYGWNYETGFRYQGKDNKLLIDVTGFYYNLKNAIVRRLNENDTEYFVNAGGTKQLGIETSLSYWIINPKTFGIVRGLEFRNAYTLSRFKFDNYRDGANNYSGNNLTGVPRSVLVSSADIQLPKAIALFIQHNFTSKIPLNDANTVYAKKYYLLQAKLALKSISIGRVPLEIFIGADNILNQKYSLGNDLNAFGGRYFNAAATRNYYGGLAVKFRK